MADSEAVEKINAQFGPYDALLVKQTMRGCLQECLGCEAKSEFKVAPFNKAHLEQYKVAQESMDDSLETMYALEESNCFMRLCWRDGRPFDMHVSEGKDKGGAHIVHYKKPCGFPLNFSIPTKDGGSIDCPCCCLLPNLEMETPGGVKLDSKSEYICDVNLFVPKLHYKENDEVIYVVKPETCCGGCCIACNCCSGKGLVYTPFYFHDPNTMQPVGGYSENGPQIRKVWAGLKKECCSTADTFVLIFPEGDGGMPITPKRKAGLLGMTFLIDFTWFERQQDNSSA